MPGRCRDQLMAQLLHRRYLRTGVIHSTSQPVSVQLNPVSIFPVRTRRVAHGPANILNRISSSFWAQRMCCGLQVPPPQSSCVENMILPAAISWDVLSSWMDSRQLLPNLLPPLPISWLFTDYYVLTIISWRKFTFSLHSSFLPVQHLSQPFKNKSGSSP
jgi:hypothetical protein